jgi:DNA-binding response OmpR family regulator
MSHRVLLVEDDLALREVTACHLAAAGYVVEAVGDGAAALAAAARTRPALVVLDLNLPGGDGLEVCRELRARFQPTPGVVMVTARGAEADVVIGLDAGADDYVVKPFAPPILLARLAAVARRLGEPGGAIARWGAIVVDRGRREAVVGERRLALTPTEFALLWELVRQPGVVLTRRQLLRDVFGTSNDGYARNVDCHVTRLRRKLEAATATAAPIHAVAGAGYRLGAA